MPKRSGRAAFQGKSRWVAYTRNGKDYEAGRKYCGRYVDRRSGKLSRCLSTSKKGNKSNACRRMTRKDGSPLCVRRKTKSPLKQAAARANPVLMAYNKATKIWRSRQSEEKLEKMGWKYPKRDTADGREIADMATAILAGQRVQAPSTVSVRRAENLLRRAMRRRSRKSKSPSAQDWEDLARMLGTPARKSPAKAVAKRRANVRNTPAARSSPPKTRSRTRNTPAARTSPPKTRSRTRNTPAARTSPPTTRSRGRR